MKGTQLQNARAVIAAKDEEIEELRADREWWCEHRAKAEKAIAEWETYRDNVGYWRNRAEAAEAEAARNAARVAELEAALSISLASGERLLALSKKLSAAAQWRPVTEKPEPSRYIVALPSGRVTTMQYAFGTWQKLGNPPPTHWQPLPPPPDTAEAP